MQELNRSEGQCAVLTKRVAAAETAAADAEKRAEVAEELQILANTRATAEVERLNKELAAVTLQRTQADTAHAAAIARHVNHSYNYCPSITLRSVNLFIADVDIY